jgi:hypothetical protein
MIAFFDAELSIRIMDSKPVYTNALKDGIPQDELYLLDYPALS